MARRRTEYEVLPLREELETLIHAYDRLSNEHKQAKPGSSVGRRIEDDLLKVRLRFDRVLAEWVPDEDLQAAWRVHLEGHGPAPAEPVAIQPVAFRGVSDESGSKVEVRRRSDDELEVWVGGSLLERIGGEKDLRATGRPVRLRVDNFEFRETFAASPEALAALVHFVDGSTPPPWEHAGELLADGLIDSHFGLTPRGRRALNA